MPVVRAVERTIRILQVLGDEDLRLVDIAQRLGLHKATVSRLLASLMRAELAERDDHNRYCLGPGIVRLASRQLGGYHRLLDVLAGPLRRIHAATQETVTVHVRLGRDRVCIEELESPQAIAYRAGIGQRVPVHIGSAGKVLLAFLPDDERSAVLHKLKLVKITDRSITSVAALEAELARVRRDGYAFSSGERVIGASAVSVPVFDEEGRVVATISVLAPESRLGHREQARCLEVLKHEVPRVTSYLARSARDGAERMNRWMSVSS